MPRCLRCQKRFKDERRVLAHMNHPSTSCHTHFVDLVSISNLRRTSLKQPVAGSQDSNPSETLETNVPMGGTQFSTYHLPEDSPDAELPANYTRSPGLASTTSLQPSTPNQPDTSPFHFETHPNISQTYGSGLTFMDKFDADPHAQKRSFQLYYPFSSKGEWELASFLLQSSLSMGKINVFLKLELVSSTPT